MRTFFLSLGDCKEVNGKVHVVETRFDARAFPLPEWHPVIEVSAYEELEAKYSKIFEAHHQTRVVVGMVPLSVLKPLVDLLSELRETEIGEPFTSQDLMQVNEALSAIPPEVMEALK